MNYSEVKGLLEAGFTADEIRGMLSDTAGGESENPNVIADILVNDSEKEVSNKQDSADNGSDQASRQDENTNNQLFETLNTNIQKLINTIQASNLRNNTVDKMSNSDLNSQVDSIMASMIRPEQKKGD